MINSEERIKQAENRINELELKLKAKQGALKSKERTSTIGIVSSIFVFLIMAGVAIHVAGPVGFLIMLGIAIVGFLIFRDRSSIKYPLFKISSILFNLTLIVFFFISLISISAILGPILGPIGIIVVLAIIITIVIAVGSSKKKRGS